MVSAFTAFAPWTEWEGGLKAFIPRPIVHLPGYSNPIRSDGNHQHFTVSKKPALRAAYEPGTV